MVSEWVNFGNENKIGYLKRISASQPCTAVVCTAGEKEAARMQWAELLLTQIHSLRGNAIPIFIFQTK